MEKPKGLALITGASRGLGKSIACHLVEDGYDVVLVSRKSEALDRTVTELQALSPKRSITASYADLLDESECIKVCSEQPIDIVVNCGIYQSPSESSRVDAVSTKELSRLFQGNVTSQLAIIQTVLPGMIKRKRGVIFQLVSASSRVKPTKPVDKGGFQGFGYSSTKAAISKLIPILALEYQDYPFLKFFNIDPGLVITDKMRKEGTSKKFEKWGAISPDITGKVIVYLSNLEGEELKKYNGMEFLETSKILLEISRL